MANVVTLIAAAKALEALEADKKVKVISVTGVSAGSIAACMLASPHRIETHRRLTIANGASIIDRFNIKAPEEPASWLMKLAAKKTGIDEDIFKFVAKISKGKTLLK